MYCIILADRPHRSWKRSAWKHTFLKTGLRVEKSENAALPFSCPWWMANLHTFPNNDAISPPLDLWNLWRLITTTTITMADYCLCSCFLQCTRLVVECESQQQFDLIIDPHKRFWFPWTSHFHRLLVFGFSFYCLKSKHCACSVSSSPFLVNFKRHLEAWNVNYSVLSRFQWFRVDPNIHEMMPRKTEGKKVHFGVYGQGLTVWGQTHARAL